MHKVCVSKPDFSPNKHRKTSQSVKINPVWYGNSNVRRNTTPVPMSFIGIQTHKSEIPALTREFTLWDIKVYLTGNAISSLA